MGGDRRFYYPKYVWSPAGGWWGHYPKNWQRNRALAFATLGFILIPTVMSVSSANERRPIAPRWPIPSQLWCAHAGDDDARLGPISKE